MNMLISIDEKAVTWFAGEFEYKRPFSVRLFPQYAGFGEKHKGYSLAFSIETPANSGFSKEVNGMNFYIEENDLWFFEDTETYLSVDDFLKELHVIYKDVNFAN